MHNLYMKHIIITLLLFFGHISMFGQSRFPAMDQGTDMGQWVEQRFAKGKIPPFSFVYGGKKSDKFIQSWQYKAEKIGVIAENEEQYIYTYTDKGSGLVVTCTVTCFTDFPAVEWVLNFSNNSKRNTPLIEKVAVVDHSFISEDEGTVILHHARGSDARKDDFGPIDEEMEIGKNISIAQQSGRSSSHEAFPFFNIEMSKNEGIMVAIGWTGQWYADVMHTKEKTVSLKSGMQKMQLMLYPQEKIRSPRICLLFWKGEDRMVGHNSFRQFVLKHHSKKINGQFAEYPISVWFSFGDPTPSHEFECLTESYALAIVDRYRQFDIVPEIFWLDAGWYSGCECGSKESFWWHNVGNWTAEKSRFPNGLRPVADAIHKIGSKFMVWFEPERVRPGSFIARTHPEWLITPPYYTNSLFDLGNEEARLWLTDYISDIIIKEGIDYYRQDFNIDPYPYWNLADKPGRIGIPEIKHVEGLYAFWDSLLVRFPNLLIDNCAAGGRRLDLETISRSAPLWRTDFQYGEPNGKQCHTYGLNFYLPIHGTGTNTNDDFNFHSGLGAAGQGNFLAGDSKEAVAKNRKYIEDLKELRPYFYGDYYPLTPAANYTNNNTWLAYQMNRPDKEDGIIVAFRRIDNEDPSISVKLAGLNRDAIYELFYEEYNLRKEYKGSDLMESLDITIRNKPSSLLIRYKKIKN